MTRSRTRFFLCAIWLLGCAVQEPAAGNDGGTGGEGGGENGGGTGGVPLAECRAPYYPYGFLACAPPSEDSLGPRPTEFTVVGAATSCVSPLGVAGTENADFVGWEIEDASGARWVVGFWIEGVESSLLNVGDNVVVTRHLESSVAEDFDLISSRGYIAIEKEGLPVVFFAYALLPELQAIPDLAVEPAAPECAADACWTARTMRVTAGGGTVDLERGGTAVLAGLTLRSRGVVETSRCNPDDLDGLGATFLPADYMLAGYRTPE